MVRGWVGDGRTDKEANGRTDGLDAGEGSKGLRDWVRERWEEGARGAREQGRERVGRLGLYGRGR